MCCLLVSGFFTEITQQIHSLRASGVISSHFARAAGSERRTLRRSLGTLWIAPAEIVFLTIASFYIVALSGHVYCIKRKVSRALQKGARHSRLIIPFFPTPRNSSSKPCKHGFKRTYYAAVICIT
jgi:hypothetical protein